MATLDSLLDEIKNNPNVWRVEELPSSAGGLKKNYRVWYKQGTDAVTDTIISIWVDESGNAYFDKAVPAFLSTDVPFKQQVTDKLKEVIANNGFITGRIESIDGDFKNAIAIVYNSDGTQKKILFFEQSGTLNYIILP